MTQVHAELVGGGESIALLAAGPAEDVAAAAKRLKALTPLFTKSDPPGALLVPTTWSAVVQLREAFGDNLVLGRRLAAWVQEQIILRTNPRGYAFTPSHLTPYPWQTEGAGIIAATGRALITDEPGTGKTITSILGLMQWAGERQQAGPIVVICPASVVDPWVEAWHNWTDVRAVAWRGAPAKRKALPGTADVYVTSYETARMDAGVRTGPGNRPLYDLEPIALVIDECHLIKNPHTARSQATRRLAKSVDARGGAVVALSGTPITHTPGDLFSTLSCLEPGAYPSKERWVQRYCATLPGEYSDEILGLLPSREPEFRLTLLGQHRRVAKADVLADLPPKIYSVRTVELPAQWRKAYDAMESSMLAELPDGSEISVMSALAQLTRLAQLASSAADVTVTTELNDAGEEIEHVKVKLKDPSWKVDALLEVLSERPGEPVVVFAPSRQLIQLAGQRAAAEGYKVGYIVGGQSMGERTKTVEAFQNGELDLICVTTAAGGVGITLTAARTCVFLQRPWALVEAIQAEDRCHRIGSEIHDSIEVIDIVAKDTIDTRVRAVLRTRAGQLADLVQDPRIVAELLGGKSVTEERKAS